MTQDKEEKKIELRSEDFQDILGTVPPWILRWGVFTIAIIVIFLLVCSSIFKYPDIISSQLTLTGTTPVVNIVAKSSGKIVKIYFKDNQAVVKEDYIAIIENTAKTEDVIFLKSYLNSFSPDTTLSILPKKLEVGDLQASYSSFLTTITEYNRFVIEGYYLQKIELMKIKIMRNEAYYTNMLIQKKIIVSQFELTKNQYSRDSTLRSQGVLSEEDLEKSLSRYLQGLMSVENIQSTLDNLHIQIAEIKESLIDAEYLYCDKKSTFDTQLRSMANQLQAYIQNWELNYVLTAPISGDLTFTKFWIENQNIVAGDEVFNIVPNDNGKLIGRAILPTTRSGKVKVGQKVNIRFSNYPDHEYGIVKGTVDNISIVPYRSEKSNNYMVEICLPDGLLTTYKKELVYQPNMEGQADIITDDMSLLERFILPIKKIMSENL